MAIIDVINNCLRGKLGGVVCEYRRGVNYMRANVKQPDPKTRAQQKHRYLFGQLQGLGAIWKSGYINPYYSGDLSTTVPFNKFISYNWSIWDKSTSAWLCAVPFWGYGANLASSGSDPFTLSIPSTVTPYQAKIIGFTTTDKADGITTWEYELTADDSTFTIVDYDADKYAAGLQSIRCWIVDEYGDALTNCYVTYTTTDSPVVNGVWLTEYIPDQSLISVAGSVFSISSLIAEVTDELLTVEY